jgi:transposase
LLAAWLIEHEVEEVVMESTAQYWKPVWGALERYWKPSCQKREGAGPMSGTLHLAQARSNRGRGGRKRDFPDAERLVKRLVADELILSFVPDAEQRLWRTVTRRKYQLTRNKVRLQNQLEALLEEAHIKLSSLVSDLLGVSARRMLKAVADGATDPAALAALADKKLRATQAQLCDALGACAELQPVYRRLLKMFLEELQLIEQQSGQLDPRDGDSAQPASGGGPAAGGNTRLGCGFGAADHCRGGCCSSDISFRQAPLFLGGSMPRRRRKRGSIPEPPLAEG